MNPEVEKILAKQLPQIVVMGVVLALTGLFPWMPGVVASIMGVFVFFTAMVAMGARTADGKFIGFFSALQVGAYITVWIFGMLLGMVVVVTIGAVLWLWITGR
jgi:hypothetical protein